MQGTTSDAIEPAGPVLIIGAGPTGLSLAWALWRQGITPRIVDAGDGPAPESRATAVHARTLEVLGRELADALVARAQRLERAQVFDGGGPLAEIPLTRIPSPYPFSLAISQGVTEATMIEALQRVGIVVERRTSLTALAQDATGVSVTLAGPAGERTSRARWVVGCDGVHSTTRSLAGIELERTPAPRWWWLGDVRLEGEVPPSGAARVFLGRAGILAMLPVERAGWWRVVAVGEQGEARPEVTVETLSRLLAARSPLKVRIVEHGWLSAFRIREHVARRYRAGRVLIAGDAAHAHSPLGGQGMNTGIQDACNLGWKLALVERGAAHERLLDSYERERRPQAEALVRATRRGTKILYARSPWVIALRNAIVGLAARSEAVRARARHAVEMLSVAYPQSPIVGQRGRVRGVRPGHRGPLHVAGLHARLDRPEHLALFFPGPGQEIDGAALTRAFGGAPVACVVVSAARAALEGAAGREGAGAEGEDAAGVEVVSREAAALREAFGIAGAGTVIVRPDGYVGWCSSTCDPAAAAAWWRRITRA